MAAMRSDLKHDIEPNVSRAWPADPNDFVTALTTDPHIALQFCQALVRSCTARTTLAPSDGHQPFGVTFGATWESVFSKPDLSIVIPVYDEEENLPTLYSRLTDVLAEVGRSYEVVFVDDGSRCRRAPVETDAKGEN
jgi:hypothetical protein